MKIGFLGDIALIGRYDTTRHDDVYKKLEYLKKELEKFDYVFGNLESPLTDRDKTLVCKSMHLKSAEQNIEILKFLGVQGVSLANNHIYDYGQKGVDSTVRLLKEYGIDYCGIDGKYIIKGQGEDKIHISGFCGYSANGTHYQEKSHKHGINVLSIDYLEKQLEIDREAKAATIYSLHYGMEHTSYPAPEHIKLMNYLKKKKEIIVHGHHTHAVQGIQDAEGSLIAYSLGNAIFDDCISINKKLKVELNHQNKEGVILGIELEKGKIINYNLYGFYNEPYTGISAYNMSEKIQKVSKALENIEDIVAYKNMRKRECETIMSEKFGKKDLEWLSKRLNYYAIGSKIAGKCRHKKYVKEVGKIYEK